MNRITVALALGTLALASPALAEPIAFTAFGHTFEITGSAFQEQLLLDGTKVHENGMIFFDAIGIVGTTPVIVGTSATGGNMCGDAPFVVSFPADAPPVFEGPIDTCSFLRPVFAEGALLFRGTANALTPGEQWSWQPGAGFTEEQPIAFVPSAESGWNALLRREVTHPFDLLRYADTLTQAELLMGDAKNDVLLALSGPGSGEFHGELYAGDACFPHNCPYSQALIVADGPTHTLYMAWRIEGAETVAPAVEDWPKAAEQQLRAWEARLAQ